MREKHLGRKFMAIMLSLSMAAAPAASSGLTSYAANVEEGAEEQTFTNEQNKKTSESEGKGESGLNSNPTEASEEETKKENPTESADESKSEESESAGDDVKASSQESGTETSKAETESEGKTETEKPAETKSGETETETELQQADPAGESETARENDKLTESKDKSGANSSASGTTAASETAKETAKESTAEETKTTLETKAAGSGTAAETTAAEKATTAAAENGNPFGLSDDDLPLDRSDLLGESAVMSIADEDAAEATGPAISVVTDVGTQTDTSWSWKIKYTTVNNVQKTFTITPDMDPEVYILTAPYDDTLDGETYNGFRVLSVAFAVGSGDNQLVFYADDFVSGDFKLSANMQLSGDYLFEKDSMYHKEKAEDTNWNPYKNATFTAGSCSVQIKKPYGYYVAKVKKTQGDDGNKALLLIQTGDETLQDTPSKDGQQIRNTLARTDQFKDDNIKVMEVPEEPEATDTTNYKQKIWDWIDSTAEGTTDDSLTVIYYSGHGGSLSDGSSTIGLGGTNTITASELKQHVSQLSGKVMLVIDCCYSGGLIMTTSDDEDSTVDVESIYKQAQENAEKSMKAFVKDFKNAKTGSNSGSTSDKGGTSVKSNPQYYIYTAASSYETSLQKSYGGEISVAFGHALGYDRDDSDYNVFAADKNADSSITAKELAEYIENSCTEATPSIYSSKEGAELFTYGNDVGVPVVLSAEIADGGNNAILADGKVSVSVDITNHNKKNAISIDAMLGEVGASLDMPGDFKKLDEQNEYNVLAYNESENVRTIEAGRTQTCTFVFTEDEAKKLKTGRFVVRVWDTNNVENYALADFYIGKTTLADDPDPDAFALKKPGYTAKAANAVEVSKILPIDVAFDNSTKKTGYAACTLTAKAYDLGTDASTYAKDSKNNIIDGNNEVVDLTGIEEDNIISIYDGVRPAYGRTQIGDSVTSGSDYAYEWNVENLQNDHYYVLEISCDYDSESLKSENQSITTFIKKVAEPSKKVIGQQFIQMDDFFEVALNDNGSENTVEEISKKLISHLEEKTGDVKLSYSIAGSTDTGWWKWQDNQLVAMEAGEGFVSGGTYVNRLVMQIPTDADAVFSEFPQVTVQGHSLYNSKQGNKTNVTNNGKTLTIFVQHKMKKVSDFENAIKVCLAGTNTPVNNATALKVGDEIDVYVSNGYSINLYSNGGLEKVAVDDVSFTGKRYKIKENAADDGTAFISFAVKRAGSWDSDDSCTCGYFYYIHNVEKSGAGVSSVSAPTKTFYTIGSKLDTRGAKVTCYSGEGAKAETTDLSDFMSKNNAKLYTKSGDSYTEWSDDLLKQFGTYDLYIGYDGNYYKAFSVAVGYEQGTSFAVNGSMTKNQSGDADFVGDNDSLDMVLFLSGSWKDEGSGVKGTVKYTHSARLRANGSNAEDYEKLYPADGATISYLIPYADFMSITNTRNGADYDYEIVDADVNTPISFEKRADGLWVTAKRNGSFALSFSIGGNGGDAVPDESKSEDKQEESKSEEKKDETKPEESKPEESKQEEKKEDSSGNNGETEAPDNKSYSGKSGIGSVGSSGGGSVHAVKSGTVSVKGSWQMESYRPASAGTVGAVSINGKSYVLDKNAGASKDALKLYRFVLENGTNATGWKLISYNGADRWFYFGSDGFMQVGWLLNNGSWYYLQADGAMATGWIQVGGKWYYLDKSGRMLTGKQMIDGKLYVFDDSGAWIDPEEKKENV